MAGRHNDDQLLNSLYGKANNVVQAGQIHGDVRFYQLAPKQHDLALRDLANAVHGHWRDEAARRGLLDPAPLAVSWKRTGEPIADHAINIEGSFSGRADDLTGLAGSFRGLPRRRLIVLGEGGSGKTTLAILLVLALLKDAAIDEPVPVIMSIASWDPHEEHVHTWLARRLEEDYPGIRRYGREVLETLLAERCIMPVLDGLDEMPGAQQASVVATLNRSLTVDDPLVLTCRTAEYVAAVYADDVLSAAAIVHADPVSPEAAVEYLYTGTPPYRAHQWQPVFDQIMSSFGGPVAETFTSPLNISLARTIYARSTSSPAELLDTGRFPTRWIIEHFLLGEVIPSSYKDFQTPLTPRAAAVKIRYEPRKATRWLTFLARHLYRLNTRDFVWWQLKYAVPKLVFGLAGGCLGAFILLPLLLFGFADNNAIDGEVQGLFTCYGYLVAGLTIWSATRAPKPKSPRQILIQPTRHSMRAPKYALRILIRIFLVVTLVFALLFGLALAISFPYLTAPVLLTILVLSVLFLFPLPSIRLTFPLRSLRRATGQLIRRGWLRVTRDLWTQATDLGVTTPRRSLRSDRIVGLLLLISLLLSMLVISGALWLLILAGADQSSPSVGYTSMLIFPMIGITLAAIPMLDSAWWNFLVARLWLGLRGHLPLRLMRFLDDARERQLLRQSGELYQFRHARLHDRLLYH